MTTIAFPISTAPKDGTPIFLWTDGRWIEGRWDEFAYSNESTEEGYWKLRWAETDSYGVTPATALTHWAPLLPNPNEVTVDASTAACEAVMAWWQEHQFDVDVHDEDGERNRYDDETLEAIGADYGITKERVRQIIERLGKKGETA